MGHSRVGNYHANRPNSAKIKLVQDFISVPVICKFDEDPIKNEVAIVRTTFSPLYKRQKDCLWKQKTHTIWQVTLM